MRNRPPSPPRFTGQLFAYLRLVAFVFAIAAAIAAGLAFGWRLGMH